MMRRGAIGALSSLEGENAEPPRHRVLMRLVWLTPAMDRLFDESAATRRRFFDRLVAPLMLGTLRGSAVMSARSASASSFE